MKEMSMEKRLLLAFVMMFLVLGVSQYFIKPQPAPGPTKVASQQKSPQPVSPAEVQKPPVTQATPPPANIAGPVQSEKEETVTIDTDVYKVVFSNRGAVVRSWILKAYKDHQGKPLEVVDQRALRNIPAPFSLTFKGQAPSPDPNTALFDIKRRDPLQVSFEFSDGHVLTEKTFRFEQKSFLVAVSSRVTQNGMLVPHSITWRGGFGDETVVNAVSAQHAIYYDLTDSKLQTKQPKDAKNGPVSTTGQFSFVGAEDSYFAAAFLPSNKSSVDATTFADNVQNAQGKDEQRVGVGVGGEGSNTFSLFVGPKDTDLLSKIDPKLDQLVDWGWFWFLAKPLFVILNWTSEHMTHNYGWAIVLVTIAINILLFPLRLSQMKSSKKMQALQPQIQAINEKYKGLSMKDPKKAEQQQEMMDLYKKHGVNPVGGCLPMLPQIPFLYAIYKVLAVSIEMRGAHWLWISDLSQPETLAIRILPVLLIVTQFLVQKMTPNPGVDPSQQKMMMFMPIMFGYIFWFLSAGLVLYYLTGNLLGIGMQWIMNRLTPAPAPIPVKSPPKKKGRS